MTEKKKEFISLIPREVKREPVEMLLHPQPESSAHESEYKEQPKPAPVLRPKGRVRKLDPSSKITLLVSDWSITVMNAIIHKKIKTTDQIHYNQRNAFEEAITELAGKMDITLEGVFPRPTNK